MAGVIGGTGGSVGEGGSAGVGGNASAGGSAATGGSSGTSGAGGTASSGGSADSDWDGGTPADSGTPQPQPTCSDGVQNQDETRVDCGGASCMPCPCTFGTPELMNDPNYAGNDLFAVSLSSDARTMYIGGIVQGNERPIGVTTRSSRGNDFAFASLVPAPVNSSPAVEGTPFISRDGLELVFYSTRSGGAGDRDLYSAKRANTGAAFNNVVRFTNVNSPQRDHAPWLSSDALTMYYSSRRGGLSNDDIWRATRSARGVDFSSPVAVTELESSSNDTGIWLSDDGRVAYFASDRAGGLGGMDLYRAQRLRTTDGFSAPERVPGLNTSADDAAPHFTTDRQELFFVSTRSGNDSQVFRVSANCP